MAPFAESYSGLPQSQKGTLDFPRTTGTGSLPGASGPGRNELQQKAILPKTKALAIASFILAGLAFSGGLSLCEDKISSPRLLLGPSRLHPGEFLVVFLEGSDADDEVSFHTNLPQTTLKPFPYRQGLISLAGVHCGTPPGEYTISVRVRQKDLGLWQQKLKFVLEPKTFTTQHLEVSPEKLEVRSREKWQQDLPFIREARSKTCGLPLWEGRFLAPSKGRKSADFGLIRYINGKEAGRHSGIDIAAPNGTLVVAANSGIVCLARFLNVTGYTVMVDHGFNLFTSYCHLENLLVKEGQEVLKGQEIGRVGSTGFATGSHLHWGAIIGSIFVDPYLLVEKDPLDICDLETGSTR